MKQKQFILATDLDGTFLGGSTADRRTLYDWIETHRDSVGLIFVTGRDPQFIETLCGDTVPWPDFVVGDVGTTIAEVKMHAASRAEGRTVFPIAELEDEISRAWNGATDAVRTLLNNAPGLSLQETPFRYRVSYHYDPSSYDRRNAEKVRALGLDVLISDNRYFDVLPKGVSKGPSLRRLLAHLGVEGDRVLVAGDTLNDLSLFETGLNGVAVANSEPDLLRRLPVSEKIFRASCEGAGGITEAIRHFLQHTPTGAHV